jgi:formate--tetrahydrofolate ligase
MDLAEKVVKVIADNPAPIIVPAYALGDTPEEKIRKVATLVYGAKDVEYSEQARKSLDRFKEWGFAGLPVCIAKTQYSFSDNPKLAGAPTGWTLRITDVQLSAGAGFLVAVAGNMMLMPGLPRAPRALCIDMDEEGKITGV